MAKTLRFYSITIVHPAIPTNSRQGNAIVATTSSVKAAALLDVSAHHLRTYGSMDGNDYEYDLAMSQPETVLVCEHPYGGAERERVFVTLAELNERRRNKTVDKPG